MRRPLCLIFFAYACAILLYLRIFPYRAVSSYAAYDRTTQTLSGVVVRKEVSFYENREGTVILYVRTDDAPDSMVQVYPRTDGTEPLTGQRVQMTGTVSCFAQATNPGEFDAAFYYQVRGIAFRMYDADVRLTSGRENKFREALYRLQRGVYDVLTNCMEEQDAGVLYAMLSGNRSALDADTKRLYRESNLQHLLSVSGVHAGIIGGYISKVLKKLRVHRALSVPLVIFVMVAYGIFCGMPLSAVRAIVMFLLMTAAPLLGRSYDMLSAMSFAGLTMLLEQPLYVCDSAFQMSFGAICAIGYLAPALNPPGRGSGQTAESRIAACRDGIRKAFVISIAVSLVMLPVYMRSYYRFPVWSVLTNLLAVPLMGVVLPFGIVTVCLGAAVPLLGAVCGSILHVLLSLYDLLGSARHLSGAGMWTAGSAALWQIAVYVLLLGAFVVLAEYRRRHLRMTMRNSWHYILLLIAVLILSFRITPSLQITMLDVGQGDGIVVRHGKSTYLIDGGSTSKTSVGTYQILPYLKHQGIDVIDAVFVSHEDEDHISGILELMEEMSHRGIRIGQLVLPDAGVTGENDALLVRTASVLGIPVTRFGKGDGVTEGRLSFTCLGPVRNGAAYKTDNANAHSMILSLSYGTFSALFTGDVEGEGLTELSASLADLPASSRQFSVLKVAHHGSRFTTDEHFLSLIDADISLISCGRNNRYGHPHAELLDRLKADGTFVLTTADHGAITVRVSQDGSTMDVETFLP